MKGGGRLMLTASPESEESESESEEAWGRDWGVGPQELPEGMQAHMGSATTRGMEAQSSELTLKADLNELEHSPHRMLMDSSQQGGRGAQGTRGVAPEVVKVTSGGVTYGISSPGGPHPFLPCRGPAWVGGYMSQGGVGGSNQDGEA